MMSEEEEKRIALEGLEEMLNLMRNSKDPKAQLWLAKEVMAKAWSKEMNYAIELLKQEQTALSKAICGSQSEEAHCVANLEMQKDHTARLEQELASVERALMQLVGEQ